jgi:hypothetical protein
MAKTLYARILAVLESLDEPEAHGKASDGQCAQFLFWESLDPKIGPQDEPECTCDLGALILELSEEDDRRCVRYRRAGKRFGGLPVKQMGMF